MKSKFLLFAILIYTTALAQTDYQKGDTIVKFKNGTQIVTTSNNRSGASCQTIPSNVDSIEQRKHEKRELRKKRQYVRHLLKEGWKEALVDYTIEIQFAYKERIQQEKDSLGRPVWQIGKGNCIGKVFDYARESAKRVAISDVVSKYLSTKEWDNKRKINIKSIHFDTVIELYKKRPNGSIEVWIEVAVPTKELEKLFEISQD